MTDTPETLQAALADLRDRHNEAMKSLAKWTIDVDSAIARVAAFEQAQKRAEEEEPPALRECRLDALYENSGTHGRAAIDRLRYCERELARLREGLRRQEGEMPDRTLSDYMDNPERVPVFGAVTYRSECVRMAREIQRHRALVGGGK